MKKNIILMLMFMVAMSCSAKKVKVTIDGTTYRSQKTLYLVVNEDTANAIFVPIVDSKFSVTLKVDEDAFIRLCENKRGDPKDSHLVLIPDSKHITVEWDGGKITGSEKSVQLKQVMDFIKRLSPEGFHIDVFSDDKEEWARARETANSIRTQMEMQQREEILKQINENSANNIPAWLYFCYHGMLHRPLEAFITPDGPKWINHKVINVLNERLKK